jgi:3-oxoacyl-[acyl-carrier protein] reductase
MISKDQKIAVISGGTGNIGSAICKKLTENNIYTFVLGSNAANFKSLQNKLDANLLDCILCDISNTEDISNSFTEIKKSTPRVDYVVNCAGTIDIGSLDDLSEEIWDKVLSINLKAIAFIIKESLELLRKSNSPRVVNISSNAGRMGGFKNGVAYSASKGAVISLTYSLARKLAGDSITVNCIAPGCISSDMLNTRNTDEQRDLLNLIPLARFGMPDEVASALMYFLSNDASFTTGAVLDVNGGMFMG